VSAQALDPWGILTELRALRAEHAKVLAKLDAIEHGRVAQVLDVPAIGKRLGKSTDAARMWLSRRKDKIQIVNVDGRDGVRVDDLERLLSAKRQKRTRAVPKGRAG
jgi:hypothetical protein